jgi:TonB family protein
MMRDVNTPLVLWICAAICAHYLFAEGGDTVAQVHEDRMAIAGLGAKVRERVRFTEQTFEVSSIHVVEQNEPQAVPPTPPPPPKPKEEAKAAPVTPPKPIPPKANEPKPQKKIAVVVTPEDPAKKLLQQPQPQSDRRIAVRQHVKPNQTDNPNARYIGDEANKVEEETVATQTSHDKDDENPTPGGNHAGPEPKPGDSERTRIAESEEHPGEQNRAPGERGSEFEVQHLPPATRPQGPVPIPGAAGTQAPRAGGDGHPAAASQQPPNMLLPGGPGPAAPEVIEAPGGNWSFNPIRPGAGNGSSTEPGPGQTVKPAPNASSTTWLGLGGKPGPGQINLNLNQMGVVASVGQDQLRKEREADGERRKSEHRGSWTASNFERWRSAIENYVSSVKPGNQTALNTAAVPFASYLNGMHNRIHPIFADAFLASLDSLPRDNPLNDQKLITRLEIVVTRDGHLVRMGVVKTSGVTAFDIAALDSVQRASPFGPAPTAIVSPDGRVYLHWEFHRDEVYACSTMNARPFMLNVPATSPPIDPNPAPSTPTPTNPSHEPGAPPPANVNETREGALPQRLSVRPS